jgi:hypothetical protein
MVLLMSTFDEQVITRMSREGVVGYLLVYRLFESIRLLGAKAKSRRERFSRVLISS